MFGIVNSSPISYERIMEIINSALSGYIPKSGGEITGELTGSDDTTSINIADGNVSISKYGDAQSQEVGGTISDSIHTTYYGMQIDSIDESNTNNFGEIKVTPEYVQTNSGSTSYEKITPTTYDVEVGNQSIIHYDTTNGLQISNVAEPTSNNDVATKGYTDTTVTNAISDAVASGGVIDTKLSDYVPTSRKVNNKALTTDITLDANDVGAMPSSGGTLTGDLILNGSPTSDNMAATKKYVDDSIIASGGVVIDSAMSSTSENPVQNKVIYNALQNKVDSVSGKGLSTNDFTNELLTKVNSVESNAEENVIDGVTVNGTDATITNRKAEITVPTKTSDLTNDSDFVSDASYVHTDNNYTTTDKNKLSAVESGAEVNVIDTISINGTDATVTNKKVDITVPTKVSDITNDSGFQTASDVASAINSAIGSITSISFEVVTSLPATGENGVIYLISNGGTNPNIYDEYIYVNNNFEKIGTTEVDLSNYLQLSGGTMTGALTLSGDPTDNLHASTKQYVDSSVSTLSTSVQTQIDSKSNKPTVVKTLLSASGWGAGDYIFIDVRGNAETDPDIDELRNNMVLVDSHDGSGYQVLSSYTPVSSSSSLYTYQVPIGSSVRVHNTAPTLTTKPITTSPLNIYAGSDYSSIPLTPSSDPLVDTIQANNDFDVVQSVSTNLYFSFTDELSGGLEIGAGTWYDGGTSADSNVYSLESLYPSTSYDVSIEPNGAMITSAQYEAWSKAQILGNPDENTIRALGTVPTVDIPVVLTVTSK